MELKSRMPIKQTTEGNLISSGKNGVILMQAIVNDGYSIPKFLETVEDAQSNSENPLELFQSNRYSNLIRGSKRIFPLANMRVQKR